MLYDKYYYMIINLCNDKTNKKWIYNKNKNTNEKLSKIKII